MKVLQRASEALGEIGLWRPRLRPGVALGAVAAGLASAALVYWIGASQDPTLSSAPPAAGAAPTAHAPLRPDPEQVVRAYQQVQETYAEQGPPGVARFARACAANLAADPGTLDFCIAFDIYAAALTGPEAADAGAWRAEAATRDLALVRAVLPPGQDPAARLAAIGALARQTSLAAPEASEPQAAPPPPRPAPPASPPQAVRTAARSHAVAAKSAARASSRIAACRRRAIAAQRTVCASPALRQADQRLRVAYRGALAAGLNPRRLARDQARFRASVNAAAPNRNAVARLYKQRIRALESKGRRRRSSAG